MPTTDELVEGYVHAVNAGDLDAIAALMTDDATLDWSRSIGTERGVYDVRTGSERLIGGLRQVWDEYSFAFDNVIQLAPDAIVIAGHLDARGVTSGAEVRAAGAQLWRIRDGLISRLELHQSLSEALRCWRSERLAHGHLYFVCDSRPNGEDPAPLLDAALRGGVDIVQLRDPDLSDEDLVAASAPFRDAARDHGSLFILNDRPDLVDACGADGVHVGQDDAPVAEARRIAGEAAVVGLSTHSAEQVDAAVVSGGPERPDQISIGPVWETPTKPGRPAAGLELLTYARDHAVDIPWFAIGGIDVGNVGDVVAAGASRLVVVRAIRDAHDPEEAARELRAALEAQVKA